MTPERWKQIEVVFSASVDLDPGERDAILDELCADDGSLRAEVEELLIGDEKATRESFLETATSPRSDSRGSLVGQRIGPYEIKKHLDEGGMGDVYLAVRVEDFQRQVAIKLIKPAMDTEQMLRRFKSEMQIHSAVGEHTNIAALLDAGATEDGRPYFVMEYVEGERIDHYCDHRKLSIHDRVELFRSVLSAVQYAHQNLVIHLDLKPSNILVNKDGKPKLVDFGISKLVNPDLASPTVALTGFDGLTWEYASPEQVRRDPIITTASDVYSLGMILYQLLTGHRPHHFEGVSVMERKRIVCEEVPEMPSIVISREVTVRQEDDTNRTLAAEDNCGIRNSTPAQLRCHLARDMDKVLLCALRKEPQRRFESVSEFSDALRHWLEWRPVPIPPSPTLIERFRFWCRRNPAVSGLIVLVGVLVGLVAVVTMVGFYRTNAALDTAKATLEQEEGFRWAFRDSPFFKRREEAVVDVSEDPAFRSLLKKTIDATRDLRRELNKPDLNATDREKWGRQLQENPTRILLQQQLQKLRKDHNQAEPIYNWFVLGPEGLFLAREPAQRLSVGKSFAWRTYFHGGPRDYKNRLDYLNNAAGEHLNKPHLSAALQSKLTKVPLWAVSAPVIEKSEFIGVVGLRVEIRETTDGSGAQP